MGTRLEDSAGLAPEAPTGVGSSGGAVERSGLRGPSIADRLAISRSAVLLATVVLSTFVVTYWSAAAYWQRFSQDTTFYAAMSLRFGGASQQEAVRQVAEVRARSGWSTPASLVAQMFDWGLVQPRIVYPALSVPFVKIWGITGMLVVPGLALAILMGVLTWLLARRWGGLAAAATVVLIMSSTRIMFYGSAMLTESLSALWSALILVAAWAYQRRPGRSPVIWMVVLTVLSGFTRQATLIPAGAFVTAWLIALIMGRRPNRWGVPALVVGVTSVAVQVLQTVLFPSFSQLAQFELKTGAHSLAGALWNSPKLAIRIIRHDLLYFATSDHALLILVTFSVLSMVIFWRRTESHLLLGAMLGILVYNVTNGTPTAFRYAMPGLVFYAVSVALLISRADLRPRHSPELETPTTASPRSLSMRQ